MPSGWTDKDERQFDHIRRQQRDRGKDRSTAREIAARTVNTERRREGRTERATTSGTGNPNTPLPSRTKQELYNRERALDVSGRSGMSKAELVDAIRDAT